MFPDLLPRGMATALMLSAFLLSVPPVSCSITTARISISSKGAEANNHSNYPSVSADGRYVAFQSGASNLVSGDTNNALDIFVRDTLNGETRRVSLAWDGSQGINVSEYPSISGDGRYVAFYALASNLVPGDTNDVYDVFLRDTVTPDTKRASVSSLGVQANNLSHYPSMAAEGDFVSFSSFASNLVADDTNRQYDIFLTNQRLMTRLISVATDGTQANDESSYSSVDAGGYFVAFQSFASNLVPGDTNGVNDIFLRDVKREETTRVSVSSAGVQGNQFSTNPSVSSDGRLVAFRSFASNLVSGDTNNAIDIFVRNVAVGATIRVSTASDGTQGNADSGLPSISADGLYVAFSSSASNLVEGDTNGVSDIFVKDLKSGATTRVSIATDRTESNGASFTPRISADGRWVAYESAATNLVEDDTNGKTDIFVSGPIWEPPPFEGEDIIMSLRTAAGLNLPAPETVTRLNVEPGTPGITISDSVRIARKVAGLEANP